MQLVNGRAWIRRAGTILIALTFACTCLTRTRAQETTLTVRPLRDGGGLERGLNARLTTALARFLTDHTPKTVQVGMESSPASQQISSSLRYTVEGDLSFTGGADEANARFLLVTRLFRESAPRVLVGQWAGTADSLRSLTVNLRRDPRVHALGLVGETGSRIVACLNADAVTAPARWTRLLPHLTTQNALWEIVSADDKARPLRQTAAGSSIRLRSRRDVSCRAYLLLNDAANGFHLARLSESGECWTVRKGQSALSSAVSLPEGVTDAWVVTWLPGIFNACGERGAARSPGIENPWQDKTSVLRTPFTIKILASERRLHFPAGDFQSPELCFTATIEQNEAPVQMLDGVGNQQSHADPALKQLLDEIAHAPQVWRVQKLRITETK